MNPSRVCLTDYISIDNLQIIFDEISLQDNIALRLWSPHRASTGGGWITPEWNNSCHFHNLIRSYPSGNQYCYQYFQQKAVDIQQGKRIDWHKTQCPTSLYVFGWPIYDENQQILAILFGGLIRGKQKQLHGEKWNVIKAELKKDHAVIKELENEYNYVTEFTEHEIQKMFAKWKLFCELFSQLLAYESPIYPQNEIWIERLTSFYSCSSIAYNLVNTNTSQHPLFRLTLIENATYHSKYYYYQLFIDDAVVLGEFEFAGATDSEISAHRIPINKSGSIMLAFNNDDLENQESGFFWEISKKIISGILINTHNKDLHSRKLLLERQSDIFEKTSKQSITQLEDMIVELFEQLRETGVIKIDYASFSEVVYFPQEAQCKNTPHFKARVVYPKENWTTKQIKIIEAFDLYTETPFSTGSTVYAFQKSRPVLDRVVKHSPTYVCTQESVWSSLVIPINYGPLVLGVIAFDSVEVNYFNDERMLQLENLTQLIAPIVYHKNFQEILQELNNKVETLAKNLTKESRKKIREHILTALSRLIQADAASFWIKDSSNDTLIRDTSIGNADNLLDKVTISKSAIGGLYLGKEKHILVENLEGIPAHSKLLYSQALIEQGISSYLAFPVSIGGKRVIISFYRHKHEKIANRDFSEVELNITQKLGEILSFYETLNDIFETQRHELEKQIESREEMAITLAHNIKSPLSAAFARLDDVKRKLKLDMDKELFINEYHAIFDEISSNFFAIKRSTTSVLGQLSLQERYEAGIFDVKGFHLYYDILARQIGRVRRGLKILDSYQRRTVEISGHKQFPLLYGDKVSIEDMISNLLENAVKYSYPDDKIFIETHFDYASGEIHVSIKNTGKIHILKQDSERIFEYGYRSKMARDKDPSSTGVGLYYSRYVAEHHGGRLFVIKTGNPVIFKLVIPYNGLKSTREAEETLRIKNQTGA